MNEKEVDVDHDRNSTVAPKTVRNSIHSKTDTITADTEASNASLSNDVATDNQDMEAIAQSESRSAPIHSIFNPRMRNFIVFMTTISTLFSPMASFIYLPAIDTLSAYYHESVSRINLTVTTYQILQGLSPMFYGNMADTIGRRPVYVLTFIVFLFANLGLALQNSFAALMVLRAMQSAGSSSTVALGNAVIADVATPSERAGLVGYVYAGIMLGPAIAPVLGGIVTQFLSWRWIFWLLMILTGAYLVPYIVLIPETCRNVVDDGSIPPPRLNMSVVQLVGEARRKARGEPSPMQSEEKRLKAAELAVRRGKFRFPNPIESLKCILEPDVALVMLYQGIMVAAFYSIMVPITPVFSEVYGFDDLQVGLCYIPFAFGAGVGSISAGKFLNWNFARTAKRLGIPVDRKKASKMRDFPIEKARLGFIFGPNLLAAAGMICWGWALEQRPNLAAPLIILVFTALGATGSSTMVNTILVDLYPQSPATVGAAANIVRCLISAGASAVIQDIINTLGIAWCYTLIAGIIVLNSSLIIAELRWGPGWRAKRTARLDKKQAEEKAKEEAKEAKAREAEKQHIEEEKNHIHVAKA